MNRAKTHTFRHGSTFDVKSSFGPCRSNLGENGCCYLGSTEYLTADAMANPGFWLLASPSVPCVAVKKASWLEPAALGGRSHSVFNATIPGRLGKEFSTHLHCMQEKDMYLSMYVPKHTTALQHPYIVVQVLCNLPAINSDCNSPTYCVENARGHSIPGICSVYS